MRVRSRPQQHQRKRRKRPVEFVSVDDLSAREKRRVYWFVRRKYRRLGWQQFLRMTRGVYFPVPI